MDRHSRRTFAHNCSFNCIASRSSLRIRCPALSRMNWKAPEASYLYGCGVSAVVRRVPDLTFFLAHFQGVSFTLGGGGSGPATAVAPGTASPAPGAASAGVPAESVSSLTAAEVQAQLKYLVVSKGAPSAAIIEWIEVSAGLRNAHANALFRDGSVSAHSGCGYRACAENRFVRGEDCTWRRTDSSATAASESRAGAFSIHTRADSRGKLHALWTGHFYLFPLGERDQTTKGRWLIGPANA